MNALIALPLVASPLVYLAGHLGRRRAISPQWVALIAVLAAWAAFWAAAQNFAVVGPLTFTSGAVALRLDGIGLLLAALTLTLGTLVILFSGEYVRGAANEEKYYAMLVAMMGAMIGLGSAADLFNLWMWFEVMAVASYLLVMFHAEQPASLEAGVKYLIQSAAGSALVLVGIGLTLAFTGTLDLAAIHAAASSTGAGPGLLAAGALFVIGFGIKAALVPLHTWLPDAHSQAPSGISAMLSGVVIMAGLIALLRALGALEAASRSWGGLLLAFGALNLLVGNLLALRQTQIKRLLAFSSLSHVGYILLGMGISIQSGQAAGAQGGFFHLFNHGLMKGLAFLAAGALMYALLKPHTPASARTAAGAAETKPLTIDDLSGAARRYPLVALAFSVALFGLGGLPPLAGFMSKWQIFAAGFAAQNAALAVLVVFAALNSVLSLVYYVPLVNAMYRESQSEAVKAGRALPLSMCAPLILTALIVIVIGFWPGALSGLTEAAGAALMAFFGG